MERILKGYLFYFYLVIKLFYRMLQDDIMEGVSVLEFNRVGFEFLFRCLQVV